MRQFTLTQKMADQEQSHFHVTFTMSLCRLKLREASLQLLVNCADHCENCKKLNGSTHAH